MILTALLLSSIQSLVHAGWISWFSRYNNTRLKIPFHFFSNTLLSRDRLCSHSHQFPSICSLPTSCFPGCSPFPMAVGVAVWPALLLGEGKWQTNTRPGQECFPGLALKSTHLPGFKGASTTNKIPRIVFVS